MVESSGSLSIGKFHSGVPRVTKGRSPQINTVRVVLSGRGSGHEKRAKVIFMHFLDWNICGHESSLVYWQEVLRLWVALRVNACCVS